MQFLYASYAINYIFQKQGETFPLIALMLPHCQWSVMAAVGHGFPLYSFPQHWPAPCLDDSLPALSLSNANDWRKTDLSLTTLREDTLGKLWCA